MATVTYIGYRKQSAATAKGVCEYVSQEQKTMQENGLQLVSGQNCSPQFAVQEFMATRQMHHKKSPVWFYHYVQSFHPDEPITGEQAHTIAKEFSAQAWPDSEVLIATHVDADHIHSHFIVNAVCLESGKMLRQGPNTLKSLRKISDELCQIHGLSVLPPKPKTQSKGISGREYRSAVKGQSVKFQLMNTIDECMKYTQSREEFIAKMKQQGYEVRWEVDRKHITYTTPSGWKCRDDKLHEEKYLKERMEKEFAYRTEIIYGRTEASQRTNSTADTGAEYTVTSHTGRVESAAGSAVWTVRPASGATSLGETSADPLRNAGANAGADPGSGSAADRDRTGWEKERAAFFSSENPSAPIQSPQVGMAGSAVCLGNAAGLVADLARVERSLDAAPQPLPVTYGHTDRKRKQKIREMRIAQGHAEDDHEDELNNKYQQRPTM